MPSPISVQLYTVRDLIAKNGFAPVVKQIADTGFVGVETAGVPQGMTAKDVAKLFKELGLKVSGGHFSLPLGAQQNEVLEQAATLGCERLVSGKGPDDFKTPDLIKKTCDDFNASAAVAAKNGLTFCIHNHWWEFEKLGNQRVYEIMLDHLQPNVLFEVDIYWVQTGGCDPATVLKQIGKRAPLLHVKDGPCVQGQPMTAVGDGKVDVAGAIKAAGTNAEWLVVELDECATDMMEAVRKSYRYLVGKGLARGNKN